MFNLFMSKGNKKPSLAIQKQGEDYFLKDGQTTIFSHNKDCIERAYKHIFERHIYDFNATSESPLIIDAGANIGLGVLYWKRKYPKARIIAFEPSREVYKSLVKNVEYNNLSDVTCINKALADKEAILHFSANEIISGSLILEKKLEKTYEVEATSIAPFLKEKVDLLKIDIEGAERLIFEDVKSHISNISNIFLEYHSFLSENQYLAQYLDLFEKNNLRYYIENDIRQERQFVALKTSLTQDLQLNIWAKKTV